MRLQVLLPSQVLVDTDVIKVIAEAENGSFCLLPRHIDFVAALAPGLLIFVRPDQQETFLAVDQGTLVKCGTDVMVSTRGAVQGTNLEHLKHTVEEEFRRLDAYEEKARTVLAKLEADTLRRFVKLETPVT